MARKLSRIKTRKSRAARARHIRKSPMRRVQTAEKAVIHQGVQAAETLEESKTED